MTIAFPHGCEYEDLFARAPIAVEAVVRCTAPDDRAFHCTVERSLKGPLAEGTEIEIRPAPADSPDRVKRRAPDIQAGRSYEFLLLPGTDDIHVMAGANAWRSPVE